MNIPKIILLASMLATAATGMSCRGNPQKNQAASQPDSDEHAHGTPPGDQDHDSHPAKKISDLDRSLEELFSVTCEHRQKTFACDECRYEVGVVRAPSALLQGGLVKTAKSDLQKVAAPIALTGEIQFDERRVGHISSQVEGVIKKVHVALGDKVKAGQPLLEIESVAIGDAQAAYLEAQAMLELAQQNFQRALALRQENISSEKEFLQAQQDLEAARIRSKGALGKLTRLGTDGARGRLVLRAPLDGSVLVMHAVSGEVAKSQESLITVGDHASVWVWADLYESDIAAVLRGQAAQKLAAAISVKAYPGEEFKGLVDLVSPSMDETSRTVKVRIEAKNADGRLLAGMFATVKLFLPSAERTLAVPREAVLEDEGRSFVFIHHHDDFYVRRPVKPGRSWAGLVEITHGLNPSQTVVTEGAFLMKSDVLRAKMGAGCAD